MREGVSKAKIFKRKYETKLEFPEGWGAETKKTLCGGVWIFSGTAHLMDIVIHILNNTGVNCFEPGPFLLGKLL